MQCTVCIDGADRSLAKKKKKAESSSSNLMVEIVITLLLESKNGFCSILGWFKSRYEPTRSETFEERLVFFDVFGFKHLGMDLTSRTQNVLIYAM